MSIKPYWTHDTAVFVIEYLKQKYNPDADTDTNRIKQLLNLINQIEEEKNLQNL